MRARLAGLESELVSVPRTGDRREPSRGVDSEDEAPDGTAPAATTATGLGMSGAARWQEWSREDAGLGTAGWDPADDDPDSSDESPGPADSAAGRRSLRIDPGSPGLVLLCVVAVLAAALAAGATWLSRPSLEPVPEAPVVEAAATPPGPATPSGPGTPLAPAATASAAADIVVAVVGQVVTPGLVTLAAGSRVADAVAAAGGALPGADLATVNLARILTDGEQVAVGVPGATDDGAGPPAAATAGPVNLNTASQAQLEELPGVGPVLAERIVTWRTDNGGFSSVEQLQEVAGIGPATFDELRDEVTV